MNEFDRHRNLIFVRTLFVQFSYVLRQQECNIITYNVFVADLPGAALPNPANITRQANRGRQVQRPLDPVDLDFNVDDMTGFFRADVQVGDKGIFTNQILFPLRIIH